MENNGAPAARISHRDYSITSYADEAFVAVCACGWESFFCETRRAALGAHDRHIGQIIALGTTTTTGA